MVNFRGEKIRLKGSLIGDLKLQLKQTELQLQSVNERWHIENIEAVRNYYKGVNDKVHHKKTLQLSARQEYEKAIKPVEKAFAALKKEDKKSQQELYAAVNTLYENEAIGEAIIKVRLTFNPTCGSCYHKLKTTVEKMLKNNKDAQSEFVQTKLQKIKDLKEQIELLESEITDDIQPTKGKRGRPKKETTEFVQESGDNK